MTNKDDEPVKDQDPLRGEDEVICHGRQKLTRKEYYRALCHIGYDPDEARKMAEKLKAAEEPVVIAPSAPPPPAKRKPTANSKPTSRVIGDGG